MITERNYRKLHNLSVGYVGGKVSLEIIQKAVEIYGGDGLQDDVEYNAVLAKSFHDFQNNLPQEADIVKAILPGQTKVVDGVMYIWSPTKNGSKTDYQWHVVKKTSSKKGGILNRDIEDDDIDKIQSDVNSMFPKDLSVLKTLQRLGGSTGAVLVEDPAGNKFVMKKGSNTNNGHVKSEYLTNQLYDILGIKTPDYEMYEENGETVLLSKFIPLTKAPTSSDYGKMAQHFVADALLANWDVYMNDNCLIDAGGRVIRVNNGGALNYRAQGSTKPFDDNVVLSFNGMVSHNQAVYNTLSKNDIIKQIAEIKSKKSDIVDFLKESGQDSLAATIGKRIDNLSAIIKNVDLVEYLQGIKPKQRKLKSKNDMYRELTDKELTDLWDKAKNWGGNDSYGKIFGTGKHGWEMLNAICELRGFNARPTVISDDDYWKEVDNNKDNQIFRGISQDSRNKLSFADMAESLMFEDDCFWGTIGVYGEGLYAANGDKFGDKSGYQNSHQFREARSYARQNGSGFVVKGFIEKDAKIAKYNDLVNEIAKLRNSIIAKSGDVDDATKDKIKNLEAEGKKLAKELMQLKDEVNNFRKNKEKSVYDAMNYDPSSIQEMYAIDDSTDWDYVNAFGEREIPSFKDYVEGNMVKWVKAQGGDAKIGKGHVVFSLPDADTTLTVSKLQYDGPHSIKRKNAFTPGHNYAVNMFHDWMAKEKIERVSKAVDEEIEKSDDEFNNLVKSVNSKENEVKQKEYELNNIKSSITSGKNAKIDSDASLLNFIANRGAGEVVGLYAAIKGIDVIEAKAGSDLNYKVVLNRSKLVLSSKVDMV